MAETDYRKTVAYLGKTRYATSLFKHEELIIKIINEYGEEFFHDKEGGFIPQRASFLGSGTEGEAWRIGPNAVLKIHTTKGKYDGLVKLPIDSKIIRLRPIIFGTGEISNRLNWAVLEYFEILEEYDLDLDILIAEICCYIEEVLTGHLKYTTPKYAKFDLTNTNYYVYDVVNHISATVRGKMARDSDYPINSKTISIKDRYRLISGWYVDFVRQLVYMYLTDRADDLYLPNLGIVRDNSRRNNFMFFDW